MNTYKKFLIANLFAVLLGACNAPESHDQDTGQEPDHATEEAAKGPHGGRLLIDNGFSVELAIYEAGVPPEYRAWPALNGQPLPLDEVSLDVVLTRLGDPEDNIAFRAEEDYLRGDTVISEPHSFAVAVNARYQGQQYEWQYDSFEGRTRIGAGMAQAFGLETAPAGPAEIHDTVSVYGRIQPIEGRVSEVRARFEGQIRDVRANVGERVRVGDVLAIVESNESLIEYSVKATIDGVVTAMNAVRGEQTAGRQLFTLVDTSEVWAALALYPADHARVQIGALVNVSAIGAELSASGKISQISPVANPNQSVTALLRLDNADGKFVPGVQVSAEIEIARHSVPIAVKRNGLQSFRDFTVVYAQIGDQYEVRMLELGRQDSEWAEVLGGLAAGTRYVTTNSYLVKADIEKSGASHDH